MNSCACIVVDSDYEPSCSTVTIRKARKQHVCDECGRTIKPGERYEHISGIWDGHADSNKTCLGCKAIRNLFFCDLWVYGEVWNAVDDHILEVVRYGPGDSEEIPWDGIAGLPVEVREKVCGMIQKIWDKQEIREMR